jgi:NADPH2:quinone reductase
MRAIQLSEFGGPENLVSVDLPTPKPSKGQLLIRVEASGVTFADTLERAGGHFGGLKLPIVLGSEVAGTIIAVGPSGSDALVGMRVVAPLTLPDGMWTKGGYAEYALISESDMVSLPEAVSSQAAVALLSQGLAAALMVREAGSLAGTSVLVHSAGSGIGSIVVQLARIGGARKVIGLASSAERRQHILDIGADLALDSSAKTWPSEVLTATGGAGASLIFDGSGGEGGRHNLECIAEFGRLVIYGSSSGSYAEFSQQEWLQLLLKNASITGFGAFPWLTKPAAVHDLVTTLIELVSDGKLKLATTEFPLEEASEAHRAVEERRTIGKVVLVP